MDKNIGQIIGVYEILDVAESLDNDGHKLYIGKCIHCGRIVKRRLFDMKSTSKCIHKQYGNTFQSALHHWKYRKLKMIFSGIKARCYNFANKSYRWYGAKGIKVCDEWISNPGKFEEWAIKSGYADGLTIDRIDPSGDYEPNNCRWLTQEDNVRRAGKVNWITVGGETLTGKQWAKRLGFGKNRINKLIRKKGIESTIRFIEEELSRQNQIEK